MVRAGDNFVMVGTTDHAHEQAGLDFVRERFPPGLHARALIDMFQSSTGRHYEIDFIVIGYGALFVVEMKDYEGEITGDDQVWWLRRPGELEPVMRDAPLSLTNHKSKVLKGKLERWFQRHARGLRVPFVQPLVFLSNPRVDNRLVGGARTAVVGREGLIDALQHGKFPNANQRHWRAIGTTTRRALEQALDEIGLRPRETRHRVHAYVLDKVIADGPAYQDREAQHESLELLRARARVYLVPQHTTVEERDRLRRAARRESRLLLSVHEHPGILGVRGFADDAPLGPTLLLDDFEGGAPLDAFLTRESPSFDERLDILRQIGHALAYCHRREVIHGGLHPGAVLVRRREDKVEVRLFNFQLGAGRGASATAHRTMLSSDAAQAYQAPELIQNPRGSSRASDCFSLGALAHLLFTNQPPASNLNALMTRLQRDRCLDPAVVADDLPQPVVNVIREATGLGDRLDDAAFIVETLVEELRQQNPEVEPESTAHVLEAEAGDILSLRYTVRRVLGQGASARVLLVEDGEDGREYALKVARDSEQNPRLELEAEALALLAHPRIVKLHRSFEIDELRCLQLSLAGERTLHKEITEEGGLGYDWAQRYGEDLLEALEHCEDEEVLHRDIKPANLGVGSLSRRTKHLTLFDFSLAAAPEDKLDVGTPAYRDPFLWAEGRQRWDAAADRWSAAVTLHEMLTGVRPSFTPESLPAMDPGSSLVLAAERFDAALRDSLLAFFERALARDPAQRFASAREMKRAWSRSFELRRAAEPAPEPAPQVAEPEPYDRSRGAATPIEPGSFSDAQLAKIRRKTPISALPLSPRAVNALDRAGLTRAEELLALPNNRLSAIRGIGTKVAREILALRDAWRERLEDRAGPETEPFYPRYRGDELYLDALLEPAALLAALEDAGLRTTGVLARAPRPQVEAVLARLDLPGALDLLRATLERVEREGGDASPANLEAWIDALAIGGKRAGDVRLRQLLGLEPPFVGRLDLTVRQLAGAAGVTDAAIRRDLGNAIKRWRGQPWAAALRGLGLETLDKLGGVAPLPVAAAALRPLLTHDESAPDPLTLARCGALLRIAAELGADDRDRSLVLHRRLRGRAGDERPVLWLVSRPELWLLVANLGDRADKLAEREPLAASGEVERTLELVVQNTGLSRAEIGLSRLVELAAWASRSAAASSRLELYPLGMPAARALELSAQALGKSPTPDDLARRVHSRYPEAQPLPPRPALDRLLEPFELRWDEVSGSYRRPRAPLAPSQSASDLSLHRLRTRQGPSLVHPGFGVSEERLVDREFQDELRALAQDRKLRVLGVNAAYLPEAVHGIERVLGVSAVTLDRRLIDAMEAFVQARGGSVDILRQTDAAGPGDPHWPMLCKVAQQAAAALAKELLPPERQPLLLVQLGLLARYDLRAFLDAVVAASADDRSEAIVLLNPIHDGERPELIANRLPIPGLLPGQVAHVPREFIGNYLRGLTGEVA